MQTSTGSDIQKYGEDALNSLKNANWVVRVAMALLVGAGLYVGLPYIASIAENLLKITIDISGTLLIGIATFSAVSFLWANRFLFKRMRERWSRKLWQTFIYSDPLDYIQSVIDDYVKVQAKLQKAIENLTAILKELHDMGQRLIDEATQEMKQAEAYADDGNEREADLRAYFALSNNTTAEGISQDYHELQDSILVIQELEQGVGDDVRVMRFDLNNMKTNLRIANVKAAAADAMQDAMGGNPTEFAMREYAKEAYRQQVAAGKAKFDAFLTKVGPILESKRIQKVIATKEGRQALTEFRKNKTEQGGLKGFRERIEELKRQNPDLYARGGVDLNRFKNRGAETLRRRGATNSGSFSSLQ